MSKYMLPHLWRQDEPESFAPIKYDPQFGFDGRREIKREYNLPQVYSIMVQTNY